MLLQPNYFLVPFDKASELSLKPDLILYNVTLSTLTESTVNHYALCFFDLFLFSTVVIWSDNVGDIQWWEVAIPRYGPLLSHAES